MFQHLEAALLCNPTRVEKQRELRCPRRAELAALVRELANKLVVQVQKIEQRIVEHQWHARLAQGGQDASCMCGREPPHHRPLIRISWRQPGILVGLLEVGVEVEAVSPEEAQRLEVSPEYAALLRPQVELVAAQLPGAALLPPPRAADAELQGQKLRNALGALVVEVLQRQDPPVALRLEKEPRKLQVQGDEVSGLDVGRAPRHGLALLGLVGAAAHRESAGDEAFRPGLGDGRHRQGLHIRRPDPDRPGPDARGCSP
mmetsp:Transcript_66692/g.210982  ORF Transcript_66692/g.210982 Transcript_66692/m.210982 type:complete len:259 (+) Transcript_66692:648-1424(+)